MMIVSPVLTSRKILTITYQTPYEDLQGTPTTLPVSEPGSPQISYTVDVDDLPALSIPGVGKKYMIFMFAGGQNTDGSLEKTLYFKMLKNGGLVYSGSGNIPSLEYWTLNCCFSEIAVGDLLTIKLWGDTFYWDYEARQIQVTDILLLDGHILSLCDFAAMEIQPVLIQGWPNPLATIVASIVPFNPNVYAVELNSPIDISPWQESGEYGLFQQTSLADAGIIEHDSSIEPSYYAYIAPTQINVRGFRKF